MQIARQINKTHGERIATSQHGILNKIDSTLEKELLHSITKGEEWQGPEGNDSILFNWYLSMNVLNWGSIRRDTSVSC